MIEYWQHLPERINPALFSIGPVDVAWYGVLFAAAFIAIYLLLLRRVKCGEGKYSAQLINDSFVWAMISIVAGARIGYCLFYDLGFFLAHPLKIILPFDFSDGFRFTGIYGMSYHGGLIGGVIGAIVFCRKKKISLPAFLDFIIPAVPLGYTLGRLGNFINGELYGRVTSVPWGMYFPLASTHQLRHPSQLYEAFFEGIFLFMILWPLRNSKPLRGFLLPIYLIGYASARFIIEFFREPDLHMGFIVGPFTMGQILCAAMICVGIFIIALNMKRGYNI